ncbi:hypothetical protein J3998_00380 [Thiomicrorhabdus sp. 6S2-11]|uniref:Uncharacterized protein n=1 Tax=Thiomicrorhabdus marina TaxID=2818442 RepID=A0ABS3Q1L7_9GAMM|nr:hypothetical protein [Thiomicrorhabdus marina]MBO1926018.1 hypothetical protein [Thiomicrorhabdus marina]
MKKFIANKDLLKDFFQAITYFVFIAGLLKLAMPSLNSEPLTYKLLFISIIILLSVLATFYAMFHVSGSITKLYFPDFKIPFVDPEFKPTPLKQAFKTLKRADYALWLFLGVPYYLIGLQIIQYGFNL